MTLDQLEELTNFYGLIRDVYGSGNVRYLVTYYSKNYIKYYVDGKDLDLVIKGRGRVSHSLTKLNTQEVTSLIEQLIEAST